MSYEFPPDIEHRVRAQIESGQFQTEDDVLREAIETLEKRQHGLQELRQMVGEAEEDIEAGRVGHFDVDKTMKAVGERLAEEMTDS